MGIPRRHIQRSKGFTKDFGYNKQHTHRQGYLAHSKVGKGRKAVVFDLRLRLLLCNTYNIQFDYFQFSMFIKMKDHRSTS